MEDLQKYIASNDKTIDEAIGLFEAYGNNLHLLQNAKRNKTKTIHATLDYELEKILKRLGGEKKTSIEVRVINTHKKQEDKEIFFPILDKNNTIETLVRQQQHYYNLGAKLSNQLVELAKKLPNSPDAKLLVSQILDAKNKYNELAEQKKHFIKFGEIPAKTNYTSISKEDLLKKLKLLRVQVSKAKKSASEYKLNEAKYSKYKKKLEELQKELLIVENLLCS